MYAGYNDAGEPQVFKRIEGESPFIEEGNAVIAMLIMVREHRERYGHLKDFSIEAKVTDENGRLIGVYDDN